MKEKLKVIRRAIEGMLNVSSLWLYSGDIASEHMVEATALLKGHGNLCDALEALKEIEKQEDKPSINTMLERLQDYYPHFMMDFNNFPEKWICREGLFGGKVLGCEGKPEPAIRAAYATIRHHYLDYQPTGEVLDRVDTMTWTEVVRATDEDGVEWEGAGTFVGHGNDASLESVEDIERVS